MTQHYCVNKKESSQDFSFCSSACNMEIPEIGFYGCVKKVNNVLNEVQMEHFEDSLKQREKNLKAV